MMSLAAARSITKDQAVTRWRSLQNRFARVKEQAEVVAERGANAGAQAGGFTAAYIARKVMRLKGMKTGFGEQQQLDAFLLAGLATAVFGVSPFSGKYGSFIASGGMGIACAGSTDLLDKAAAYLSAP